MWRPRVQVHNAAHPHHTYHLPGYLPSVIGLVWHLGPLGKPTEASNMVLTVFPGKQKYCFSQYQKPHKRTVEGFTYPQNSKVMWQAKVLEA